MSAFSITPQPGSRLFRALSGTAKYNALSKRRAVAVRTVLTSQFGIDGARLTTDGKGETQPIDKNETAVGKANNRRVESIKM